jgi:uncharacterized protein with ParB-like and HNH nuclease domain
MPNQYTPAKKTVGELLSMTNPPIVVPEWQRNYSWTTSEVETFWNDLLLFDRTYPERNILDQEYFLGSIVIVDNNISHLLLDGQQRLATSAILISVIRDFLRRYSADAAMRVATRYLTDFDDAQNRNVFKLTLNRYDRDFFRREILEMRGADFVEIAPTMDSHRLIRRARQFFVERLETRYTEFDSPEQAHQWALRLLQVLTGHFSVVAVISEDEDNAATVFETLNDRGIGLSTPDLVRNLVLRRATSESTDEIIELWRVALEIEGDSDLKTFIRHYWLSYEGDVKTQSLYKEIKEKILSDNIDSLAFSRSIRDSSLIYRDIVAARDNDNDLCILLTAVKEIGATLLYPAILSAYEAGEPEQIKPFIQALVTTFIRHSVIGSLENSKLENVVYNLAQRLRQDRQFTTALNELREFAPSDDRFRNAFVNASVSRRATARHLLKELELAYRTTEELDVAPPNRVHVEHIYPQNPRAGERLPNHSAIINKLGNLTLLSRRLNTTIQNADFASKLPHYEQSEILLTRQLTAYTEWNDETIETRQREMSERAIGIWSFPE